MSPGARVISALALGLTFALSTWVHAQERVVLNPGQERAARALLGLDAPQLSEGYSLGAIQLVSERVEVQLVGPEGVALVKLYPPERSPAGAHKTSAGGIVFPDRPALPSALKAALLKRLEAKAPLSYRVLEEGGRRGSEPPVMTRDQEAAKAEAQGLRERVASRLAGALLPAEELRLSEEVQRALGLLQAGDQAGCRALLGEVMLGAEGPPPVGAISLWLAAGGLESSEGCRPGVRCALGRIRQTSSGHFSRIDPQSLDMLMNEPRALTLLAAQWMQAGQHEEAAATLWLALAAPIADPAALSLARRWGWTESASPQQAGLPDLSFADREVDWSLPLAAMLLFILGVGLAARRGAAARLLLPVASLILGGLIWFELSAEETKPALPDVPEQALEFGRGGACELSAPWLTSSVWRATGACEGSALGLSLAPSPVDGALSVKLRAMRSEGGRPSALSAFGRSLDAELDALASGTWRLETPGRARGEGLKERISAQAPLMRRALIVSAVVAAMALPGVLALLWEALLSLSSVQVIARRLRPLLFILIALALLTHVLPPSRMVMVFSGYDQVHHLAQAEALRYGPGAIWIYGPWLWLSSVDHALIQGVNRGLGFLSLVVLWALVARLVPARPRLPLLFAALSVSAPLLWRDHASESLLVGGLFVGLIGLFGVLRARDAVDWLMALPCLVLSAMTRPEFAFALSVLVPALILTRGRDLLLRERAFTGFLVASALALGWVHYETMSAWVGSLRQTSALESVGMGELLWRVFSRDTVEVVWGYGPLALLLFIGAAFWARQERPLIVTLAIVASLWAALTRIDLPQVSIPRVHAPIWLMWCLIGAIGLDLLVGALMQATRKRRVLLGAGLAALWLTSAGATLPPLYHPTNEDSEEALIQEARRHIGDAPFAALATMLSQDPPPSGKASRAFPAYLFNQPNRPLVLSGLSELQHHWVEDKGPVYALLGVRCYAEMREESGAPAPSVARALKACADFRDAWELEPIIERDVPNYGDRAFPMYPDTATLRVGFYRVVGRRGASPHEPQRSAPVEKAP